MTLTLLPTPCPIESKIEQLADLQYPNGWDREGRAKFQRLLTELIAEARREQQAEINDLRCSVIAFGAAWAAVYARNHGLPDGHLSSIHYDILAGAGARMDDFIRVEPEAT